ncbi:hypothetical protein ACGK9R_17040 [Halomonas sp. HNIBRBA4712]|uniref:hypothetical protein n=1 Tax=Halomonas sp. HNIBRBA4712 TaxID=3373087 RepID=UPI003745F509
MKKLYHDPIFYFKTNSWPSSMSDVEAFNRISLRAKAGEPDFIVLESWCLALGKGCAQNCDSPLKVLKDDRVNKSSVALCAIGLGFLRGYYGSVDENKAIEFFDKASEICPFKANYQKGFMYFEKYYYGGKEKDNIINAKFFFEEAAKKGHATSLNFHVFCRAGAKTHLRHFSRYFFILTKYMFAKGRLSGPERWWCYRDLDIYRPTAASLAEGCGKALGYFSKK